jgi:methylmalonyl-CoA mutase cobalamin-binding subunit
MGEVARLSNRELERRVSSTQDQSVPPIRPIVDVLDRLDLAEAERVLGLHIAVLGPRRFAALVAVPLLREVGDRWERGKLCVASEHMASSVLRTLLGGALRTVPAAALSPPILFTTPHGERHELGVVMAAVTSVGAGAHVIYLGPELPVEEIAEAAETLRARAVAIGVTSLPKREAERALQALRRLLPPQVELWVGGPAGGRLKLPPETEFVEDLAALERKAALLGSRATGSGW